MRVSGWEAALETVFTEAESKAFSYGTFDCSIFAADCVEAISGIDPLEDFRGTYDSRVTALEQLEAFGHGNLVQAVDYQLKLNSWKRVRSTNKKGCGIGHVQRGDVACIRDRNNCPSLAVVDFSGRHVVMPATEGGLATRPLYNAFIIWGIR